MHCFVRLEVLALRLSCEGSSDRDRDRNRGLGCIAGCVPSLLCCKPLSKLLSQGWRAQSGLRAPEWQCAACKTLSFLSRDTCRGCGKQRDVKHDEYINESSQTVAWPQQGGYPSGETAHSVSKPKGPAQVLALIGDARGVPSHLGERGAAAGDGDETSAALGTEDG